MATEEISLSQQELEDLGAKLESADLTEKDKKVLVAAFAVAASALSDSEEMSGFSLRAPSTFSSQSFSSPNLRQSLTSGFKGSLSEGALKDFGNNAIIISVGF